MAVARWALPSTILAMSRNKEAWTSAVRRGASPVAQQHYSSKLPRQPGWWAVASTFVALSHELTMMGKQAIKSRREDRGDDSDDEDDTPFQEINMTYL